MLQTALDAGDRDMRLRLCLLIGSSQPIRRQTCKFEICKTSILGAIIKMHDKVWQREILCHRVGRLYNSSEQHSQRAP